MSNPRDHWDEVYTSRGPHEVSWFRPHLEQSLQFIRAGGLSLESRIVDVGGGSSTLVDDLLELGYRNVAVVDLSEQALRHARARLGGRARQVDWIVGDATAPLLGPGSVDFWHDRAVFHFLTAESDRVAYLNQVSRSVCSGGRVLVATFGLDGPSLCSGLPVQRYDAPGIHQAFGDAFEKVGEATELHETPWGTTQSFVYCFCRRQSAQRAS